MKKKLVLLLNEYPYNPGEYSFIRTELAALMKKYNVNIIAFSPSDIQKMPLDPKIELYHCKRKFGLKEKIEACLKFVFSIIGVQEIAEIFRIKGNIIGKIYDSISFFSCAQQLRRFARKNHIIDKREEAIVYSYWFNANCLAFLINKKDNPNMKVISRIHGYDLYNERNAFQRQPFRTYMDRKIDKLFFVGDKGKEYYLNHWGVNKESNKYIVAPIGTRNDNSYIKNDVLRHSFFRIVSCSNVIPLKRVDLIIKSLSELSDMEIEWVHFGTGELLDHMQAMAKQLLGEKNNVRYAFKGFVPVEEIMEYYESNYIDCFITTSSTEGCPVSIQEAMSYGIPIIATAVGEIPNMIQGNGELLSANPTIEEIMGSIYKLADSGQETILKMRGQSRKLWEEKYNARINANKFMENIEA